MDSSWLRPGLRVKLPNGSSRITRVSARGSCEKDGHHRRHEGRHGVESGGGPCPECGRVFSRRNQRHVCGSWTVEQHVERGPEWVVPLFHLFCERLAVIGEFEYARARPGGLSGAAPDLRRRAADRQGPGRLSRPARPRRESAVHTRVAVHQAAARAPLRPDLGGAVHRGTGRPPVRGVRGGPGRPPRLSDFWARSRRRRSSRTRSAGTHVFLPSIDGAGSASVSSAKAVCTVDTTLSAATRAPSTWPANCGAVSVAAQCRRPYWK